MKLRSVLEQVKPVFGPTSLLEAARRRDLTAVVVEDPAIATITIEQAEAKLHEAIARQDASRSDADWWGCEGLRVYWAMVGHLLEAARLVGADHLPEVRAPKIEDRPIMDIYADMEAFGEQVLRLAWEQADQHARPSNPA